MSGSPLTPDELATMREVATLDNFDDLGGWRPDLQLRLLATLDAAGEVEVACPVCGSRFAPEHFRYYRPDSEPAR